MVSSHTSFIWTKDKSLVWISEKDYYGYSNIKAIFRVSDTVSVIKLLGISCVKISKDRSTEIWFVFI